MSLANFESQLASTVVMPTGSFTLEQWHPCWHQMYLTSTVDMSQSNTSLWMLIQQLA